MEETLRESLLREYGLRAEEAQPVSGGWLNEKWKITVGHETWLVKRFSAHRYDALKLQRLERALSRQAVLFALGVPCPRILLCQNRPLCFLPDGTAYMVMAFLPGRTLPPERVTEEQMASLGEACGRIHRAFDHLEPRAYREEEAVWRANPPVALLRRHFAARAAEKMDGAPPAYRQAVRAQLPLLEQDLEGLFSGVPCGMAHEDFTSDNVLFLPGRVSAVVDFDRNQFGCRWHDVGRALLSFALEGENLSKEKVRAFCAGYARYVPFSLADAARALRIAWCIEARGGCNARASKQIRARPRGFGTKFCGWARTGSSWRSKFVEIPKIQCGEVRMSDWKEVCSRADLRFGRRVALAVQRRGGRAIKNSCIREEEAVWLAFWWWKTMKS